MPRPFRYLIAVLAVAAGTACRINLPLEGLPYLFYIPFVMLAGFWAGVGPGILAAVLSMLTAEYLFVGSRFSFDGDLTQWRNNISFAIVSSLMAVVCAKLRGTLSRLNELNEDLEKQIELRIRERDQVWQLSPDMACTFDHAGRLRALSPAWQRTLGLPPQSLTGRVVTELMHPDDRASWTRALAGLREPATVEARLQGQSGEYHWLSWHIALQDELYYGAVRDITEFKAQQLVLEKTEEQLRQSQKMEAIGQLTGGLAHDFNNLLAGIMGSHDLMALRLKQGRTEGLERYLTMARSSVERAAALTHRLMAYARRQTLDPRPVDANALVQGMEELIRRTIGPHIRLETQLDPALWMTSCDPHQLDNALLNLSINARDAMPDGGTLSIRTANVSLGDDDYAELDLAPGDYLRIAVRDDGTGMTPDVARRAFDPFFTTKPLGMGTGLGLSMIYGFTQQSAGQTRIRSALGEGTTVEMYLPRFQGTSAAAPESTAAAVAPRQARGTILVVDDEETVRAVVVEALREVGYTTVEAGDAAGGLAILRSAQTLDALVSDVGLPGGMNGRQLADAAREQRPGMKALLITGYAQDAVIRDGQLPADLRVLTKPFTMDALRDQVDALMH
ncbi:ATP-binding protein [Chitinasiproducens palmae]|uniref:histidine kinase n=1 Tax=Chitinasiproducens palmae TaxID=1770053 RepID=A0A1H2PKV5_9BURK|nr:ATP-binding protein [Chitinasiproducens palmae]SDV47098.1 PAS domain S-box-containing protein [Chitinasiproducens palmae]